MTQQTQGCPICGKREGRHDPLTGACPPASLRAIDAANTRANNAEWGAFRWSDESQRTEDERIRRGFDVMHACEDEWYDDNGGFAAQIRKERHA